MTPVTTPKTETPETAGKVIDLMVALKESLGIRDELAARSPAPSDDADVINAIIEVLYDGDSPNVTDIEAAARHNPTNMARCYAKILGIISAHGIAGLEADALDTLQSSRVEISAAPSVEARDADVLSEDEADAVQDLEEEISYRVSIGEDGATFTTATAIRLRDLIARLRAAPPEQAALLPPEKT